MSKQWKGLLARDQSSGYSVINLLIHLGLITKHNINASNLLIKNETSTFLDFKRQRIVNSKDSYLLFIVRSRYFPGFEILDPFHLAKNCSDSLPDTVALLPIQIMEIPRSRRRFLLGNKRLFLLKLYPSVHSYRYPASGCNCMSLYQVTIVT